MKRQLPYHGWCFVYGNENPHGIGITTFVDETGEIQLADSTVAVRGRGIYVLAPQFFENVQLKGI
jgi:hypothetical protein